MEATVVLTIFFLLVYLSSAAFIQIKKSRLMTDYSNQVVAILRQAQLKAASGEAVNNNRLYFGVLFGSDYYQEFATLTNYSQREQSYNFTMALPGKIKFTDLNLPDDCLGINDCIIFSPAEGTVSGAAGISLIEETNGHKKTIIINQQGAVIY